MSRRRPARWSFPTCRRLHPGVEDLRPAIASEELGAFRALRHEAPVGAAAASWHVGFARAVDVVRALLGEIEALTASGDPPGIVPKHELIVQLRGPWAAAPRSASRRAARLSRLGSS